MRGLVTGERAEPLCIENDEFVAADFVVQALLQALQVLQVCGSSVPGRVVRSVSSVARRRWSPVLSRLAEAGRAQGTLQKKKSYITSD